MQLHMISGLPRSGSTLLSAILSQNPGFNAAMTSPVGSLCSAVLPQMSGGSEFATFFTDKNRGEILRGLFASYYKGLAENAVIFDTNRRWCARLPLMYELFPAARAICCVREVPWIIDSLERAFRKNPMHVSRLFNSKNGKTIYGRVEAFMESEEGLVGSAWSSLREAWFGDHANKLIVVPYERLASDPERTMKRLYEAIGETYYPHRFDQVDYQAEEYDLFAGTPGLHTVRSQVRLEKREPSIPPDIFQKYADTSFWLNPKLNPKKVLIL